MAKALVPGLKPLVLGSERHHFRLHETGVDIVGRPDFGAYEGALAFAQRSYKASGFWMADLLRYGSERADWSERLSQAEHVTGISEKRLKNIRAVGAIDPSRRRDGVEFALHEEVAGLTPEDQSYWLERAETEGWTRSELRLEIRASKRRRVIEGQAILHGRYRVLVADPPWRYGDSGVISGSAYGRAEAHYQSMSIEAICAVPVPAHTMPNAVLFLWVPASMLMDQPGPREVIEAWGFQAKTGRVWDKVHGLPSYYAQQVTHEHLLICTRGDGMPDAPTPHDDSIFRSRATGAHSEKPNGDVLRWIQKHWTIGPRLYLFASEPHPGWECFGNDARLWPDEAREPQ